MLLLRTICINQEEGRRERGAFDVLVITIAVASGSKVI